MSLDDIIFGQKPELEKNPMLAERTLEDIIFSKKKDRRFNDRRRESGQNGTTGNSK